MNEHWKARLARFEEAPVVDIVGIIKGQTWHGWSEFERSYSPRPEPDALGFTWLTFEIWRVGKGETHLTKLSVNAIFSYKEYRSRVGPDPWNTNLHSPVVHIKARLIQDEDGRYEAMFEEWIGPVSDDAELNIILSQLGQPVELDLPPLPHLEMSSEGEWSGVISLPLWGEFYLYLEGEAEGEGAGVGAGGVTEYPLTIFSFDMPPVRLGYKGVPPTTEQIAAYTYLVENERHVQEVVLQALFDNYPKWQEEYSIDEEYMPPVTSPGDFQALVVLHSVSISLENREGWAYVDLILSPQWDIEHGLGVVLHKDRIVEIGDLDVVWGASQRDIEAWQGKG